MLTTTGQSMAGYQGFWSYVHKDDEADGGRISQLARDLQAQFEMLAGEELRLFLDRDELEWGDEWRAKVDGGLESVAFFIPVLTPRYFQSAECRRELNTFVQGARQAGVSDLILPLLYVNVAELRDEEPEDDLIRTVQRIQYVDLTDVKFEERESSAYRRTVADLARRLVDVNRHYEESLLPEPADADEPDDDAPGIMDQIADMQDEMPKLTETLEEISTCIETFGEIAEGAAADVEKADKREEGARGRVVAARKMALSIRSPTAKIHSLGTQFTSQLHVVDSGVRALISLAHEADEPDREAVDSLFGALSDLVANANTSMTSVKEMVEGATHLERFSRDLRAPLRKMRSGLTALMEGVEIMNEWQALMVQDY